MEKGESKDWCAPLDVEVREQCNMRESWAEKIERTGHSDNKPDMFLQVNKSEYEVSISFEGGMSGENLLVLHPNGTIRVSGVYEKGLLVPMQFLPINKDLPAWNLSKCLLPPIKIMLGCKFPRKAVACWPPLVQLHPRGALACALGGFTEWSDLIVVQDLKRLFGAKDLEEAAKFIQMAKKEVWVDAYKGHCEFMVELKKYYR